MKKIAKQMSESIELGIVLAASGGFMDAYSYIMRDHVFANADGKYAVAWRKHIREKLAGGCAVFVSGTCICGWNYAG